MPFLSVSPLRRRGYLDLMVDCCSGSTGFASFFSNVFQYLYDHAPLPILCFFFFNDTPTTEISTLSLHDALPICPTSRAGSTSGCTSSSRTPPNPGATPATALPRCAGPTSFARAWTARPCNGPASGCWRGPRSRSEEHTSELQSQSNLVCRLLLEK